MSFCAWLAWVLYDVREPKDISLRAKQAALRSFLEERRFSLSERSATLRRRSNKRVPTSTLHRVTSPLLLVISRCNAFPYHSTHCFPLSTVLLFPIFFLSSCFFNSPLSLTSVPKSPIRESYRTPFFFSCDCPSTATSLGEQQECSTGNANTCAKKASLFKHIVRVVKHRCKPPSFFYDLLPLFFPPRLLCVVGRKMLISANRN